MAEIQSIYSQFLNAFPVGLQPLVSIAMAGFLILSIVQVIKRNFIYLILLVVLLPASIPILKGVVQSLVLLLNFLLHRQ